MGRMLGSTRVRVDGDNFMGSARGILMLANAYRIVPGLNYNKFTAVSLIK